MRAMVNAKPTFGAVLTSATYRQPTATLLAHTWGLLQQGLDWRHEVSRAQTGRGYWRGWRWSVQFWPSNHLTSAGLTWSGYQPEGGDCGATGEPCATFGAAGA